MEDFFYWIGVVIFFLLILYLIIGVLYIILKPNVDPGVCINKMPVLKPVSIPTLKQPSPFHKLAVFIYEVRKWEVVESWHYIYKLDNDVELVIPKDFIFDGASIPRPFWAILNPIGLLLIPGLIHDYAYKYDQLWQVGPDGGLIPYHKGAGKDFWDELFKNVGEEVNGLITINIIAWVAVAVGGSGTWNEYRKKDQKR